MNVINQWMSLLGMQRQVELARALDRSEARLSVWKKENRIPPAAVLALNGLARKRGVDVPHHLLTPQNGNSRHAA